MSSHYLNEKNFDAYLATLPDAPQPPEPWDGRSCPACHRGKGVLPIVHFDGTRSAVPCPWCDGTGKTARERAELDWMGRLMTSSPLPDHRMVTVDVRLKALRMALVSYGWHLDDCERTQTEGCTCGFYDALKATEDITV